MLAAMVVYEDEVELYRQHGVDVLMSSVEGLFGFLSTQLS
jgi:hypothetical protein